LDRARIFGLIVLVVPEAVRIMPTDLPRTPPFFEFHKAETTRGGRAD